MWQYDPNIDRHAMLKIMREVSRFGLGAQFEKGNFNDHDVMYDPLWDELPVLKENKERARAQLGSSGGGNHFFDLMEGAVVKDMLLPNRHLSEGDAFHAIMTHSGSRGVGHTVASTYYKHAKQFVHERANAGLSFFQEVPAGYEWLPLAHELGEEYWKAMQLMGRYASANHECIHNRFFEKAEIRPAMVLENHHNFAWEQDGLIVHRKGATPADINELGIIPGTGQSHSFVTVGKGNEDAMKSSSHGAGRIGSRKQAKKDINVDAYLRTLEEMDIMTSGVAKDETYQAYKSIERVIDLQAQDDVLIPVAVMRPKIVIMGGAGHNNPLDRVTITDEAESE
jgi:tRNA-splicing ligase RtcB